LDDTVTHPDLNVVGGDFSALIEGAGADEALATLAVNAIPAVLTSDPGLYALADLPSVHYWTSLGLMPADEDDELDSDL
jgi:hypothetical protein